MKNPTLAVAALLLFAVLPASAQYKDLQGFSAPNTGSRPCNPPRKWVNSSVGNYCCGGEDTRVHCPEDGRGVTNDPFGFARTGGGNSLLPTFYQPLKANASGPCPADHPVYSLVPPYAAKRCCKDNSLSSCVDAPGPQVTIPNATTPVKKPVKKPTTQPVRRTQPVADKPNPDATSGWGKDWIEKITPLADWRRVDTTDGKNTPVYCWIGSLSEKKETLFESMKASGVSGVFTCVAWAAAPNDVVEDDGMGMLFRQRKYSLRARVMMSNQAEPTAADNKLQVVRGSAKADVVDKPIAGFPPADRVKVTAKFTPPKPLVVPPLGEPEQKWLKKAQLDAFKADETAAKAKPQAQQKDAFAALATKYRPMVKENMRPENKTQYENALKGNAVDVAVSLGAMWGGTVDKGVGPFGTNAEIQLSEAEFKKLTLDAQKKFADSRVMFSGGEPGGTLDPAAYFPVDLHFLTVAARPAGTTAGAPTNNVPGDANAVKDDDLTADEIKLLTPKERDNYLAIKESYKNDPTNQKLKDLNVFLRTRIRDEKRDKPYDEATVRAAVKTVDDFNALPDWQKRSYCASLPTKAGAGTTQTGDGVDNQANARTGLNNTAAGSTAGANKPGTAFAPPAGVADACSKLAPEVVGPSTTAPALNTAVPTPEGVATGNGTTPVTGPDKDGKSDKKPSEWLKKENFMAAGKGALIGALIGSFGGPVGALVGAAVVGGIFFLANKIFG